MPPIKNPLYASFRTTGIIQLINEEQITQACDRIKGRKAPEARALLATLYYTGARPNEILRLKGQDFRRDKGLLSITIPGSKLGTGRIIHLSLHRPLVKMILAFILTRPPELEVFWNFKGHSFTKIINKKGEEKRYYRIADKLKYHFRHWMQGIVDIPPYYLRHNRFSQLAERGVSLTDIRLLKGSKTESSVMPYLHMSAEKSKKLAKKIV